MTDAPLAKARLVPINLDVKPPRDEITDVPDLKPVPVHFNPQTLRLSYANQNRGGDQPKGKVTQFVGTGTSKLSVELVFDTSASGDDVRKIVEKIVGFIKPIKRGSKRVPPGIRFEWGAFIFRGVVDGIQETLEYFSESGVPLRAAVGLSIARQDIQFDYGTPLAGGAGAPGAPGGATAPVQPLAPALADDSVQSVAGRAGRSGDWKAIAAANDIDDPLRLAAGTFLNLERPPAGLA